MKPRYLGQSTRASLVLLGSSLASVGLFLAGALLAESWEFWYVPYNLLLAWIPLVLAVGLECTLRTRPWTNWLPVILTISWLAFLPNSFYIVTDLMHLRGVPRVDVVYDIVMHCSFILNGLAVGFLSLFLVHREIIRRVGHRIAWALIVATLFVSSFAIYVGRVLRWNSWDIVLHPLEMLVDVSDRILYPSAHPEALTITFSFFAMLLSTYVMVWCFAHGGARSTVFRLRSGSPRSYRH